ncbi:hypothetical protein BC829DRAFT_417548 [Chytridium lagenaria]|nr:hypothetical protein BC829DRAFT_417548 [Chytridium lagenaria]
MSAKLTPSPVRSSSRKLPLKATGNAVDLVITRLAVKFTIKPAIASQAQGFFRMSSPALPNFNSQSIATACLHVASRMAGAGKNLQDTLKKMSTLNVPEFTHLTRQIQGLVDAKHKVSLDAMCVKYGLAEIRADIREMVNEVLKLNPVFQEKLVAGAVIYVAGKILKMKMALDDMVLELSVKKVMFQRMVEVVQKTCEEGLERLAARFGSKTARKRGWNDDDEIGSAKRGRVEVRDEEDDDDEDGTPLRWALHQCSKDRQNFHQALSERGAPNSLNSTKSLPALKPLAKYFGTPTSSKPASGSPARSEEKENEPLNVSYAKTGLSARLRETQKGLKTKTPARASSPAAEGEVGTVEEKDILVKRVARGISGKSGEVVAAKKTGVRYGTNEKRTFEPTSEEKEAERMKEKLILSVIGQPTMLVYGDDPDLESTARFKKYEEWKKGFWWSFGRG